MSWICRLHGHPRCSTATWTAPLLFVAVVFALSPAARAADDDIASMAAEASHLEGEKQQVFAQLQQNQTQKNANEQKHEELAREQSDIAAQHANIESQRPPVTAACDRKVPEEDLEAARAECEAVRGPFNSRVDAFNTRVSGYNHQRAALKQAEQAQANEEKDLKARQEAIEKRLRMIKLARCMVQCPKASSLEGMSYCQQQCVDGAAGGLPPVDATRPGQTPFFRGRTPQDAIRDYKASGAANPGPRTLKTNAVPPSPPPAK